MIQEGSIKAFSRGIGTSKKLRAQMEGNVRIEELLQGM